MDGQPGESRPIEPSAAAPPSASVVLWTYTATTFLSALLLFSVQPMFAKMVLPILGGSPSVWAVALVFFQAALLAGYGYAHVLSGALPPATSGFVHLGLSVIALVSLPIGVPSIVGEPPQGDPYLWQFGLFAVAIGLPFVAVAANAPLLQAWFSASGHPHAKDPYFLYAASNFGSFLALLGYPLLLEPTFGLTALSRFWLIGYLALICAIAACFWLVRLAPGSDRLATSGGVEDAVDAAPTARDRLGWVGLALVPSGLLTAITTHIATDIASAPLIWVIPLSLYLLTFVLVFRERALVRVPVLLWLQLFVVGWALFDLSLTSRPGIVRTGGLGLLAFFVSTLVAHRTLYEARPSARHLTEFYLWMSFGGMLGGLFSALVAPRIFSEVFEYPLLLALTFACRPGALTSLWRVKDEWLRVWIALAGGIVTIFWLPKLVDWLSVPLPLDLNIAACITAIAAVFLFVFFRRPAQQFAMAIVMFVAIFLLPSGVRRGEAERSYFGVYRVSNKSEGHFRTLTHGTTLHGAQRIRDDAGNMVEDLTPATYYHPGSPMAKTVGTVRDRLARRNALGHYGVIGLGTGSLACYAKPGEQWQYFEIDPTVVGIASNPDKFSFLTRCLPNAKIVMGDARLTLAKEPDQSFDVLIVDAFSSDAVPVHLLTAEAFRLYARKLTPEGIVVLHISNRYLNLDAVVGATVPLVPELKGFLLSDDTDDGTYATSTSTVGVFSKSRDAIEEMRGAATVYELDPENVRPWTDDYSDILRALKLKFRWQ